MIRSGIIIRVSGVQVPPPLPFDPSIKSRAGMAALRLFHPQVSSKTRA
jgi:hypothetical protein